MSTQVPNATEINMVDSVRRRYIQSVLHSGPPSHDSPRSNGGSAPASQMPTKTRQPQQSQQLRQPMQLQEPQSDRIKVSRQDDDNMTMCFDMDDSSSESMSGSAPTRDVSGGISRVPNSINAPTDFSAASSAQRAGASSFGFVPPHLVAEQHDY